MRLSWEVNRLIREAAKHARLLGHGYVGSEHLLLALSESAGWPGQILCTAGFHPALADSTAVLLYGVGTARLPLRQGLSTSVRRILRTEVDRPCRRGSRAVPTPYSSTAVLSARAGWNPAVHRICPGQPADSDRASSKCSLPT